MATLFLLSVAIFVPSVISVNFSKAAKGAKIGILFISWYLPHRCSGQQIGNDAFEVGPQDR